MNRHEPRRRRVAIADLIRSLGAAPEPDDPVIIDTVKPFSYEHRFTSEVPQATAEWLRAPWKPLVIDSTVPVSGLGRDTHFSLRARIVHRLLTLEVSLPGLAHGDNAVPLLHRELPALLDRIRSALQRSGIVVDLMAMRVSRLDVCRTLELPESPVLLIAQLSQVERVGRLRRQATSRDLTGEYVRWANGSCQTAVYLRQPLQRGAPWLLRLEHRVMEPDAARYRGFATFSDALRPRRLLVLWHAAARELQACVEELGLTTARKRADLSRALDLVASPKDLLRVMAAFGLREFARYAGGERGLGRLVSLRGAPSYRRTRVLQAYRSVQALRNRLGTVTGAETWASFGAWVRELDYLRSPVFDLSDGSES